MTAVFLPATVLPKPFMTLPVERVVCFRLRKTTYISWMPTLSFWHSDRKSTIKPLPFVKQICLSKATTLHRSAAETLCQMISLPTKPLTIYSLIRPSAESGRTKKPLWKRKQNSALQVDLVRDFRLSETDKCYFLKPQFQRWNRPAAVLPLSITDRRCLQVMKRAFRNPQIYSWKRLIGSYHCFA